MTPVNLRASEAFLEDIDTMWKEAGPNSRSEFLRYAISDAVTIVSLGVHIVTGTFLASTGSYYIILLTVLLYFRHSQKRRCFPVFFLHFHSPNYHN